MSSATVVSQLRAVLEKANSLMPKLGKIYPNDEQWEALGDISEELSVTATGIGNRIRDLKESRAERAWKESGDLRSHALACKGDLLTNGLLKQSPVFRRNIINIFEGPKDSKFDSEDIKLRKVATRQRCEHIRRLSPSGVISWAISFAPSLWAGGAMGTDIFNCLLDDIEPDRCPPWPSIVRETLYMLLEDEEMLQRSWDYQEFLKGIITMLRLHPRLVPELIDRSAYDNPPNDNLDRRRKRRRLDNDGQDVRANQESPSNEGREMKHMYTNPEPACIDKLPEPFQTAVRQSRLWKWERSQAMKTTNCLATLFPKDNTQDVSLTIWCGNYEAYHLNNVFGLQLAASS